MRGRLPVGGKQIVEPSRQGIEEAEGRGSLLGCGLKFVH